MTWQGEALLSSPALLSGGKGWGGGGGGSAVTSLQYGLGMCLKPAIISENAFLLGM